MAYDYDLLVIGSGPAGLIAALEAERLGKRTCLIEREAVLGGAGVNTGTLPSKTLRETALYYSGALQRGLYGVDFALRRDEISVQKFMVRKEQVLETGRALVQRRIDRHGARTVRGRGRFLDAHTIQVDCDGVKSRITGEYVLIATGSAPRHPPGFPFEDPDVVDSDSILQLDRIPDTMTVVGGGVIGCEYASVFAALGVDVTLLEGHDEILGFLDLEITKLLRERMELLGVRFVLGDEVERVIDEPGPGVGIVTKKGKRFRAGKLLVASGRVGNVVDIGLETVGVTCDDRQHILVDKQFRTNVPNILAAGDVIGFPALASTSIEQARFAIGCLFDATHRADFDPLLPYGLYTIPEASSIGPSEEDARKQKLDFAVGRAWYADNARGQIVGDVYGLLKLVFDRSTRKLLGVHIIGEKATELIHVGQAVIEFGGTIDYFHRVVLNFPTLTELYRQAAHDGLRQLESAPKQA